MAVFSGLSSSSLGGSLLLLLAYPLCLAFEMSLGGFRGATCVGPTSLLLLLESSSSGIAGKKIAKFFDRTGCAARLLPNRVPWYQDRNS